MSFKFSCEACGQKLSAEEEMIGERVPCPNCGEQMIVKRPPDSPPPMPAPEIALGPDQETSFVKPRVGSPSFPQTVFSWIKNWIEKTNRGTLIAAGAVGAGVLLAVIMVLLALFGGSRLPEVDDPEVVALAEEAIEKSFIGQLLDQHVKITYPKEVSYDKKAKRRVARAILETKFGTEVIFYSVEWHDRKEGVIWVQIEEEP